jgi:hypothetical protein
MLEYEVRQMVFMGNLLLSRERRRTRRKTYLEEASSYTNHTCNAGNRSRTASIGAKCSGHLVTACVTCVQNFRCDFLGGEGRGIQLGLEGNGFVSWAIIFYLLFCMGVKLGVSHWGRNKDWGWLRIGCWGGHLGLKGTGRQGSGEDYTARNLMTYTHHQILFG